MLKLKWHETFSGLIKIPPPHTQMLAPKTKNLKNLKEIVGIWEYARIPSFTLLSNILQVN